MFFSASVWSSAVVSSPYAQALIPYVISARTLHSTPTIFSAVRRSLFHSIFVSIWHLSMCVMVSSLLLHTGNVVVLLYPNLSCWCSTGRDMWLIFYICFLSLAFIPLIAVARDCQSMCLNIVCSYPSRSLSFATMQSSVTRSTERYSTQICKGFPINYVKISAPNP